MASDKNARGNWTEAEKFYIIQQFIPDNIKWDGIDLPPGRTIKAAQSMMNRFKKEMTASGAARPSTLGIASPATPQSGRKRATPASKSKKASALRDASDDAPSKRKRTTPQKPKSYICEDDESDEEELKVPVFKKARFADNDGVFAEGSANGKVKKEIEEEIKEEKREFDSDIEEDMWRL